MKYLVFEDHILINDLQDFSIAHILECGQVFRYNKTDFGYNVYAGEHQIRVFCHKDYEKIFCKNLKFAIKYFDLDTNYANIKLALMDFEHLNSAINYGHGIRVLKQAPLEVIVSFIISANNNIPRIKNSLNLICKKCGDDKKDYHAFPTLEQLASMSKSDFREAGCGYRDEYLVSTIAAIADGFDLDAPYSLQTNLARQHLMKLKGVGRKVADCILLFAYGKTDVFPTDTWIKKVYFDITKNEAMMPDKISEEFLKMFGNLSGYAQQYLFYERMMRQKK